MERSDNYCYNCLPDIVIAKIYSYLPLHDRASASLTCKTWHMIFNSALSWRVVEVEFNEESDGRWLRYIEQYGNNIRQFTIEIGILPSNMFNAISALKNLNLAKLQYFKIIGNGSCEMVSAFEKFFTIKDKRVTSALKHVDLAMFTMVLDDSSLVLSLLANYHRNLEHLNIQSARISRIISSESLLKLVKSCRKLKDLRLMEHFLSEELLRSLADGKGCALSHLSIKCEIDFYRPGYERDQLPSKLWANLVGRLPGLRVSLLFDETCPKNMMSIVMKPEIPCSVLRLHTNRNTILYDQVTFAANHYGGTLEKLTLFTKWSKQLNDALLELSRKCTKLEALYVFCPLKKATIDQILTDHPKMRRNDSFFCTQITLDPDHNVLQLHCVQHSRDPHE